MAFEIERTFLVANDGWRISVRHSERYTDGLINSAANGKVRVRVADHGRAWITLKGPRQGIRRSEFEYEIPFLEGQEILSSLCVGPVLIKTRYIVPFAGFDWEIDCYEGALEGLIIAEIELDREDQRFELPPWIGREVTGDARYKKANLLAHHDAGRSLAIRG